MKELRLRSLIYILLVIAMLGCMTSTSLAVNDIEQLNQAVDQQAAPQTQDDYLLFGFLKLAMVLAVVVAVVWVLVRIFGRQIRARMQGSWLRVVDELSLGQNRGVVLCEIAGRLYALGVTDHQVSLLFSIDDPDLLADIEMGLFEAEAEAEASTPRWLMRINQVLDSLGGKPRKRSPAPGNFQRLMQEQSQRMKDFYENDLHSEKKPGNKEDRHQ